MNYGEAVDAVMSDRWPDHKRPDVQRWVRGRHAFIYLSFDWPFRRFGPLQVEAAGGVYHDLSLESSALRAATVRGITDENGDSLQFMDRRRFEELFAGETDAGKPWAYTVYEEQADPKGFRKRIYWGPRNDAARTLNISFTLRLAHLDADGALVDGNFTTDTDRPLWPEDFDELLILGAAAMGMKLESDPSWRPLQDDFDRLLAVMQGDVVGEAGGGNVQYARDPL